MNDYGDAADIGGGAYGDGSTKPGLYSRVTNGTYPTLTKRPGVSISQWFPATEQTEVNHLFI